MRWTYLRWFGRVLIGFVLLFALAAAGGYFYLRASLPQVSGTITVPGLGGPVQIVRDRNNIPHIYAESPADAYFGLGFAHAQDRLWQMEMNRRIGAGRLSELLGDATLDTDKFLRTLGIRHYAERTVPHLSEELQHTLNAYSAGVNALLETRSGPLPPEFVLLRHEPEPWMPADSLSWIKMMALDLSGNWFNELLRMRLAARLTPQQLQEFFPPYPGDKPLKPADLRELYRAAAESMDLARLASIVPEPLPEGMGSNSWVLNGSRTASGRPLLANDPHLGLSAPAIWYFAHLSAPGLEVIGATLPGVPGIVLGRNQHIAWGMTNTGPDTQDLYLERIDPTDPGKYVAPDGPREFAVREETIKVKDGDPVTLRVRYTRHGPVISDVAGFAQESAPEGYALSLAWTALRDDDLTIESVTRLATAGNWEDFIAALQFFHSPQQNFVYADVEGNIGFYAPGRIPVRKRQNDLSGLAPAPGWDARYDWAGFVPYAELPKRFNPRSGKIVAANQKIVPDDYRHFITADWAEPYRARRIDELIEERPVHSLDGMQTLQADIRSLMARDFLPVLLAAPIPTGAPAEAHSLLAQWDGSMAAHRPEPLIFAGWYRELTRLIYADELGDMFQTAWRSRPIFLYDVLTSRDGEARWCDDIDTPEPESCHQQIGKALELALADLKQRFGDDMERWRWGDAHPAVGKHRPFSNVSVLQDIFEISVPSPGDTYTINVGRYDLRNAEHPFANVHAASLRAIYDLADPDRSVFMHSTGQSGNVLSESYDNFAEPWRVVEYVPMTMQRADIEIGARGTLTLRPR